MDLKELAGRLTGRMDVPDMHVAWIARSFGRRSLAPLRPEDVVALATTLVARDVPAGTTVVRKGDDADAAYIIEDGEVELFTRTDGVRSLVSIQRTGGVFGDVPLLCNLSFPFDAVTRSDSRLLVVTNDDLVELLAAHPAIGLRWLSSAVRRLEHANRRLASLTTGDLGERVAALLADELAGDLTERDPAVTAASTATIDLTQAEIAALLGASRQAVNRALHDLAADDVLHTEYGRVVVDDPAELLERGGRAFPAAPTC